MEQTIIGLLVGLTVGAGIVYTVLNASFKRTLESKDRANADIREAAHREAETIRREAEAVKSQANALKEKAESDAARVLQEAELRARDEAVAFQSKLESELRQKYELEAARNRESLKSDRESLKSDREAFKLERESLRSEREELRLEGERLSRRGEQLDVRASKLDQIEETLELDKKRTAELQSALEQKITEAERKLFEVAALSREEATKQILERLDGELEEEKVVRIRTMINKVNLEVKRQSQIIIAQAIQRSASETTSQMSVSVVPIPTDAMKGRIIGREGRNIRAFESLTGVDLIIDDTPEAVILSSFNPIRREVAVKALEQLVADGRIHPTRIEEVVQKAQDEMKTYILERGEEAAIEANVVGLKPGLLQLMGRMHFRTSYAQNVLKHSIQVAHLCGIMAAELGLDAALARRAGLLHDIGKSIDREIEGTHVDIGITLAKRFGEPFEVIDAIAHHHDPENGETVFSVLAAAADAISAARPGARREDLETYVKRLQQLETIAVSFAGVENAFAIQAGREVRVIVQPDKVSDSKATMLAREIASRIEQDMEYPGQVQVTVVREMRSVEYAK